MKKYILFFALFLSTAASFAQVPYNSVAPNGYTKKAIVGEQVGLTQVVIRYHRPEVNGREGKIWGQVVHKGFVDQGFGSSKPAPWRAGANENTVFEVDNEVMIEGQLLPKGKYGLFIAYDSLESVVIFSKSSDAWGSFFYDDKDDFLRVKVKPQRIDKSVENLKYEFTEQSPNSAVILLTWEKLSIPFKVEVDHLKQQFGAFITESKNPGGFISQGLNIAANWTLQNNYQLEKGLEWITRATGPTFPGDPTSFPALVTKVAILDKLGRSEESATAMKSALSVGSVVQLQQYGRQLINLKKPKAALDVFQYNYDKNPDQFVTLAGMARGLSANGEYTKALVFATKALPLAPNEQAKQGIQVMIDKLKAGKDIN